MIDVPIRTGLKLLHLLEDIHQQARPNFGRGQVADYIPELAKVDPRKFGMAVATVDGDEAAAGDCDEPFSLQSISKLFTLILALNRGGDEIWRRVGKEPSGTPFNHLAILESERGAPRNPFVNAGALTVSLQERETENEPPSICIAFDHYHNRR